MTTLRSVFLAFTLVFASQMLVAPIAVAKDKKEQPKISKSQAAQRAQQVYAGKVLKVESRGNVYRVKIHQASGRVVYVTVDATTGKVRQ